MFFIGEPSDLKKQRIKPKLDEGYESDKSDQSIPQAPPLPNSQIKELQYQVKFWSNTANNL